MNSDLKAQLRELNITAAKVRPAREELLARGPGCERRGRGAAPGRGRLLQSAWPGRAAAGRCSPRCPRGRAVAHV